MTSGESARPRPLTPQRSRRAPAVRPQLRLAATRRGMTQCLGGLADAAAGVPPPLICCYNGLLNKPRCFVLLYTMSDLGRYICACRDRLVNSGCWHLLFDGGYGVLCCIVLDVYVLALQFCIWPRALACWSNGLTGGPKCHQTLVDRP